MYGERRPEAELRLRHVQSRPNAGNVSNATEFNKKTVPKRDGDLFLARIGNGAIAAMALPRKSLCRQK